MADIKALIIDMDGVLWRDSQQIGCLHNIFTEFDRRGLLITLATNNATKTVQEYLEKLAGFDVHLEERQIVNSSMAVAHYLQHAYPQGGRVYVVGEDSLKRTLEHAGFPHGDDGVLAVIASMDRQFTYEKMKTAMQLVRSGAALIATNSDRTFPTPNGLVPGAGAVLSSIETACGLPARIIGKPSPDMYTVAMQHMQVTPVETLVIGDRLETDIAGAQQLGCRTGLVLSGVTTPEDAARWQPAPTWIAKDLDALLKLI